MSNHLLRTLLTMSPRWTTPTQFSVLVILSNQHRDDLGFGWISKRKLGQRVQLEPRQVNYVIQELVELGLVERLGVDRSVSAVNRYRVTLDRPAVQQRLAEVEDSAPPALALAGAVPEPDEQPEVVGSETEIPTSDIEGGCTTVHGGVHHSARGGAPQCTGGVHHSAPILLRSSSSVLLGVPDLATAASQPRLPTPLGLKALKKKPDPARTPNASGNYEPVVAVARNILRRRRLQQALLDGPTVETFDDLLEATKRFCARRGIQYADVAAAACLSEWFKHTRPDVISGAAPRPRELRRQR